VKIIITTSTLPAHDTDPVPAFVKEQAIEMKKIHPELDLILHAPHNHYSQTRHAVYKNDYYKEVRYHYFWPLQWELLAGRGILPALQKNKFLYLQIPFFVFFQFISLIRLTRKERPDLLYAHWFTPQAVNAAIVSRITHTPFIFTTHASDVKILKSVPFSKQLVRYVCSSAIAFTSVSKRTQSKMEKFINDKVWKSLKTKRHILPMGVKIDLPKISKSQRKKVIDRYKLPKNKQYLLFVGRLVEIKGIDYLIEGYASLPKSIQKQFHLIIAGDGQEHAALSSKADELSLTSQVTFTGYIIGEEKDTIFDLADFVCIPSILDRKGDSEGFPVVLMEALAAGKIVLGSDVSGAETILQNGKNGFVFKQKSSEAITNALLQAQSLSTEQKKSMQIHSKELAEQYSWDTIADKHYKIMKDSLQL
jgi:glycosyltransferase involved in cell wall biosynthesis